MRLVERKSGRWMRRIMHGAFLIVVGLYLALVIFGLFMADEVIFQPHRSSYRDTPEILKLPSKDGKLISAVYLPNPGATYTLLFSHGNAEDIGDDLPLLQNLRRHGFGVLAYDYEGYGTSQGQASEHAVYADVDAAYDYLTRQQHIAPEHIISYGRSLGGAVAADLAARRPVAGLVLESSFVSAFRVLTRYPILPLDKFTTLHKLPKIHSPVLVMHGTDDQIISIWHGRKLYEEARGPKRSLWVEGAGHNDMEFIAQKRYFAALQDFAALVASQHAAAM